MIPFSVGNGILSASLVTTADSPACFSLALQAALDSGRKIAVSLSGAELLEYVSSSDSTSFEGEIRNGSEVDSEIVVEGSRSGSIGSSADGSVPYGMP